MKIRKHHFEPSCYVVDERYRIRLNPNEPSNSPDKWEICLTDGSVLYTLPTKKACVEYLKKGTK